METKKQAGTLLPMTVTEGVTVNILPNTNHEFLMTTKEVANGYGVTQYAILMNKQRLNTELIEGKHFITAITVGYSELPKQLRCAHNAILWTRRGIVRLGFTMKSERAKLFRDWAEELVIDAVSNPVRIEKALQPRCKHNRLTPERLLDIMADVAHIDDRELRLTITNKLMGGQA